MVFLGWTAGQMNFHLPLAHEPEEMGWAKRPKSRFSRQTKNPCITSSGVNISLRVVFGLSHALQVGSGI